MLKERLHHDGLCGTLGSPKGISWSTEKTNQPREQCTFEERFPIRNVFGRKPGSSGTELLILWGVSHWTLLALFGPPGCPNRAAAGIHAVTARDGQGAFLIVVPQEAGLQADVCQRRWGSGGRVRTAVLHCPTLQTYFC